jgi:uncharacterized membrane protein YecN with MAPEG domain
MTLLQWTLLGFALWTLLVLAGTVGIYRWSRILTGGAAIHEFPADDSIGAGWYKRAVRAHANCIENLPVFGVLVFAASSMGVTGRVADALGVAILSARICQTTTHVGFVQTARAVSARFTFFSIQLVAMFVLAALIANR